MRDRDAGDGGPADVVVGDQEGTGHRGEHADLVPDVREVRADRRLDLADDLERARVHDGNASALATNVHRIGHAALGFGRPQRCWRSLRMRARSRRWAASTSGWRAWALRQRR